MAGSLAKLRLAWRDLWAQGRRSVFFALLVAAGVASLVGVQGMARSLEASMRDTSRQMIQGDLMITRSKALTQPQQEALQSLEREGAQVTEILQATGHVENGKGHTMIEIKVVDPKVWPFYGGLRTSPEGARPGKGEALVGPELLTRLKLNVGDTFEVNKSTLKIIGTVLEEPLPLGQMPMGPRVLISAESWNSDSTGGLQQVLVKLPAKVTAAHAKEHLAGAFEESAILTSNDAWKTLASIMDKVFTFLSMVALISLLVGGLGVAMAMRTFINQKLEHIAVLKALGASSGTVMSVFLLEAGMLGIGGSIVGAGLGLDVQALLPKLFEGLYPVGPVSLNWEAALGGLVAGVAIALLSALIPVRAIRAIKPMALFRGDTGAGKMGWKARAEALFVGLLTLVGVAWMAVTYAKSTAVGLGFLGGLLVATMLLFLLSWVLLRVLRLLPQSGRPAARHAVRSLHAPGNQSASVVVAMGLGILLMTLVYLLQSGLIQQIKTVGAGPNTPNLFIMSFKPENRAGMVRMLEMHPKVNKVLDTTLAVSAEIVSVDGTSFAAPGGQGSKNAVTVTGSPVVQPKGAKILDGQWFTPADKGQPHLTVSERFAKSYNMHVGSTVVLRIREKNVPFTVTSIWAPIDDGSMMMSLVDLSAAPDTIDAYADNYMVTAVTKPHQEESVMADLLKSHPEAMPVSLEAYLKAMETLLARVSNILRFLTAFAVVAAGVILSGSLSATRIRRRKEAALLKSLGATRSTVAVASALENGLLGIVAGLAGGGLAYGIVQAAGLALQMRLELSLAPLTIAALAGGLLAMLVGVGSTIDVLQVKPLSVLRSE
jgi:putative ABC transport system permease protein